MAGEYGMGASPLQPQLTPAARARRLAAHAVRAAGRALVSSVPVAAISGIVLSLAIALVCPTLRAPLYGLFAGFGPAKVVVSNQYRDGAYQFLVKRCGEVRKRITGLLPHGPYLVVATSDNEFYLYRDTALVRKGVCSTGSFVLLKARDADKQWAFETPRGHFLVQDKQESPVWVMPDWAFVEEGRPIPPKGSSERFMYGVLGDYALALGHGYLIHGTLYQRFLGLPVTHGCVRLGDEDLEAVYRAIPVGGRVYIY
jgi:L,D-transpeptidase ErfK/SrfK